MKTNTLTFRIPKDLAERLTYDCKFYGFNLFGQLASVGITYMVSRAHQGAFKPARECLYNCDCIVACRISPGVHSSIKYFSTQISNTPSVWAGLALWYFDLALTQTAKAEGHGQLINGVDNRYSYGERLRLKHLKLVSFVDEYTSRLKIA